MARSPTPTPRAPRASSPFPTGLPTQQGRTGAGYRPYPPPCPCWDSPGYFPNEIKNSEVAVCAVTGRKAGKETGEGGASMQGVDQSRTSRVLLGPA